VGFEEVMRAVTVICSGLSAGLLVTVLTALIPLLRSLERPLALRVKNAMDPPIDRVNPPLVALSVVAGVVLLGFGHGLSAAAFALTAVGLVGVVGIAVVSFGFNIRLNRVMRAMPEENPPPAFERVFARWCRFHLVRTACGVLGAVAYTVAVLPGVA
jgi:uncharacterized membrane protein